MERKAAEAFPPGEFILEELEARGWSQQDLAAIIDKSENLVSQIVNGKRAITPETAVALGHAFGTDAALWLNLEATYQLFRVDLPEASTIALRARLYDKAPIKDMIRRGWIEASENVKVLEKRVLAFFERESLDGEFVFSHAARKSGPSNSAQCAWLFRARHLARTLRVAQPWKLGNLRPLLSQLGRLTLCVEEVRHVPRILAEFGIRFVVVEPIPQGKIQGACFWLDKTSPVIAVSLLLDRIDNFWFTVMHELGHISRKDALSVDVEILVRGEKEEKERLANEFSMESLVPQKELQDFRARVAPLYTRTLVKGFAARLHVHPGIVVGQIHHLEDDYRYFREMLVKTRHIVTTSALTDGWGATVQADI